MFNGDMPKFRCYFSIIRMFWTVLLSRIVLIIFSLSCSIISPDAWIESIAFSFQ